MESRHVEEVVKNHKNIRIKQRETKQDSINKREMEADQE